MRKCKIGLESSLMNKPVFCLKTKLTLRLKPAA